jgi:hypothetical protein
LDNTYPYNPFKNAVTFFPDNISTDDGPGVVLDKRLYSKTSFSFSADMYLMWQATADSSNNPVPNTIYVPLAYVPWAFDGTAEVKGDWMVTSSTLSTSIVQEEILYPQYPRWTTLVINGQDHSCVQ